MDTPQLGYALADVVFFVVLPMVLTRPPSWAVRAWERLEERLAGWDRVAAAAPSDEAFADRAVLRLGRDVARLEAALGDDRPRRTPRRRQLELAHERAVARLRTSPDAWRVHDGTAARTGPTYSSAELLDVGWR